MQPDQHKVSGPFRDDSESDSTLYAKFFGLFMYCVCMFDVIVVVEETKIH